MKGLIAMIAAVASLALAAPAGAHCITEGGAADFGRARIYNIYPTTQYPWYQYGWNWSGFGGNEQPCTNWVLRYKTYSGARFQVRVDWDHASWGHDWVADVWPWWQ